MFPRVPGTPLLGKKVGKLAKSWGRLPCWLSLDKISNELLQIEKRHFSPKAVSRKRRGWVGADEQVGRSVGTNRGGLSLYAGSFSFTLR